MLTHNEAMSKHCSLRAGGLAQDFFVPETVDDLADFLKHNQKPILMLGLGSNLLVRECGFKGVVIALKNLNWLNIFDGIIHTGTGTSLAKISRFCESQGLHGAEFLSTIPGSVGGALAMNAGAFGAEIWQFVKSVTTINALGVVFERYKKDFEVGYRQVYGKNEGEYFIAAAFKFGQTQKQQDIKTLLAKRRATQPIGQANCGSVFKNPKPHFAAKLIEGANLSGFCIGGACVCNKHANFIINQNNASATDIEKLILHIQQTVKAKFSIDLETEVVIV